MLILKLLFTVVCLLKAVYSFRDLPPVRRRANKLSDQKNNALVIQLLPWQRDDSTIKEILNKVDNLTSRVDNLTSRVDNLTSRVDELSTMLKSTQSTITNILAGITIAVAVIGGAKTLFESIEYIPTIQSKIGKIVEEGKSQNLEKENQELRNALRESRRGIRK